MIKLSSPAFTEGKPIPAEYTCDGQNISPPLAWDGAPVGSQSFALIVDDPDAPSGLFTHWIAWNIDPKTDSVPEGKGTIGTPGRNDFGKSSYGGPCPPSGLRYPSERTP